MKIHSGFHQPQISHQGAKERRELLEHAKQHANKPAPKPPTQAKFEGYSQPDPSLGRASTSYQATSVVQKQTAPLGQHIDIRV